MTAAAFAVFIVAIYGVLLPAMCRGVKDGQRPLEDVFRYDTAPTGEPREGMR